MIAHDDFARLVTQLQRHEGLRLRAYDDSVGVRTIGYGHNIDIEDRATQLKYERYGITATQAETLLRRDIARVENDLRTLLWYESLDDVRKCVLVNMVFNLGFEKFKQFKATQQSIAAGLYEQASQHMLDSKWSRQVHGRANELAEQMRTGRWQHE